MTDEGKGKPQPKPAPRPLPEDPELADKIKKRYLRVMLEMEEDALYSVEALFQDRLLELMRRINEQCRELFEDVEIRLSAIEDYRLDTVVATEEEKEAEEIREVQADDISVGIRNYEEDK